MTAKFIVIICLLFTILFPFALVVLGMISLLGEVVADEFVLEDGRLQAGLLNYVVVQAHEKQQHLVLLFSYFECHWRYHEQDDGNRTNADADENKELLDEGSREGLLTVLEIVGRGVTVKLV